MPTRSKKHPNHTPLPTTSPEAPAYPKLVAALLAKVTTTLSDDERAFYATSIADDEALRVGVRYESAAVLDECLKMVPTSLPAILASRVAGYGPLRTRYLLELASDLAGKVVELDQSLVSAAGKSAASTTSLRGTRALRRQALRALKNLAGKRTEEQERLRRAGRGDERADERSRSLEALAAELEAVVAKVPPRVAEDAGATTELMKALRQNAQAVLAARGDAQGARGALGSIYDEMNVLDGKILHELRLLQGAMKDARETDKTVPLVRSTLLRKPSRAKKAPRSSGRPAEKPNGAPAAAPPAG
jgi:hypothetical protein